MDTIPQDAFYFKTQPITIIEQAEKTFPRAFSGIAYSGDVIHHGHWGNVIFDLSTTKTPHEKTPILIEHDRAQRAGFASLAFTDKIEIVNGQLIDTPHGHAVADEADAGFPWQMSVHIQPGSVDELKAGKTVTVNGRDVTGPVAVFRDSIIREVSFTPTGVDYQTTAAVFSMPQEERNSNAMEELKAQLEQAVARAEASEAKLAELVKEGRAAEIKAALGDVSEADMGVYLSLDETAFQTILATLKKMSEKKLPEHLFSAQATDGRSVEDKSTDYVNDYKTAFGGAR